MKRKSGHLKGKIVSFIAGVIVATILFGAAVILVYYLRGINDNEVELEDRWLHPLAIKHLKDRKKLIVKKIFDMKEHCAKTVEKVTNLAKN